MDLYTNMKRIAPLIFGLIFLSCSYNSFEEIAACETISFSEDISPIIQSNCAIPGCHAGVQSPDLRNFNNIQSNASKIKRLTKNRTMPLTGSLTQQQIDNIACWVDSGAPDN